VIEGRAMESRILTLPGANWSAPGYDERWVAAVEDGKVLHFPQLAFPLSSQEQALLTPALLQPGVRNISLDARGRLKGVAGDDAVQARARDLIARFSARASDLVNGLFPAYRDHLRPGLVSLRPVQVAGRQQSWRADDTRLHVDAFPSRPNHGERILRVFANVNPGGEPRVWRVGEAFGDVAQRFLPGARRYSPLHARLLRALRVTKSLRTEYDHLMLQLHDRMKADDRYQREAVQETFAFAPGSAWVCFSDQTVHAAMSGQHMLEQTFHLPVQRQYNREASPLAILTRLRGRPLI
jgi:hypothetical protein